MDLIDVYWQEEREKEIQRLETEVRQNIAHFRWEGDELYPFAYVHNRYGEFLEFVGDDNDLDIHDLYNNICFWHTADKYLPIKVC